MIARANRRQRRETSEDVRTLLYFIDVYWCDAAGTYLGGWATVLDTPLVELIVRIGTRETVAIRSARPDILPHYPAAVDPGRAGFAAYVPGRPGADILLVGRDAAGAEISVIVELPDHELPVLADPVDSTPDRDQRFPIGVPDGPIVAVGIRSATQEILEAQLARLGDREVIGFDIHPGLGVDIIGDAHRLGEYFPPHSVAGIVSVSLLEHLTTPWLFAAQCAKVLMPGGRMFHQVPWVWPTHAEPTDFWRISPEGLRSLFSPSLGFRIVASGSYGAGRVLPSPTGRQELLLMPTTPSGLTSWVEVEKTNDAVSAAGWPYDAELGAQIAAKYPVEGLDQNWGPFTGG